MKHAKRLTAILLSAIVCITALGLSVSAGAAAWDGKTIDLSWYAPDKSEYYIATPEQLMGLAAIVNGIYNADITNIIGDSAYIVDLSGETDGSGVNGNNKSTDAYHYGADDFNGKTVYLTADLNMGGVYDAETGAWSGPNYMPIGGQYLMAKNDSSTKLSSSFCGTLDGQGHFIYNVYCERHCSNGNYGDGSSVGIIGRLGVHDNDPDDIRPTNPAVRNLAVTGYIHANRSVGGIVGKFGKTTLNSGDDSIGCTVENCANFASVSNTDAKGCGGIVGASWNGGAVRNCYNTGDISTTYVCPTGGICGSNEIDIENCYSIGKISAPRESFAMAIGTNNGGAPAKYCLINCWYLDGSAPGGGYYDSRGPVNDGALGEAELKGMSAKLGDAFTEDKNGINGGYPILRWQARLTGLFAPNKAWKNPYSDVAASAWYYDNVKYVTENALFDPTSAGTFSPDAPMTRAMLASALYRMAGEPHDGGVLAAPFTDVSASAPYADAVAWCYASGLVNGVSETAFAPDASITREQIVTMFHRYAEKIARADMNLADSLGAYSDAGRLADWSRAQMKWAVAAGLINGTTNSTISPQGTATRAQTAAMVQRLAEYIQ